MSRINFGLKNNLISLLSYNKQFIICEPNLG